MKEVLKTAFYELIDLTTLRRGISRTYGEHKIRFPVRYARYYPADYEPALFRFLKQNLRTGILTGTVELTSDYSQLLPVGLSVQLVWS
jgi:hypothetical protein